MNKLVFENVNKNYGKVVALDNFSLNIKEHEMIVILGTSGSGKTTLLRIIAGLDSPDSGNILLNDKPLETTEIRDRKVSLVFQSYALYPQMSVYQNLTLALKQHVFYRPVLNNDGTPKYVVDKLKIKELKQELKTKKKDSNYKNEKINTKLKIKELKQHPSYPLYAFQGLSNEEIETRIDNVQHVLDLTPIMSQRVSTLSGGQKQRAALGKALVKEPEILLLDEPLSNLDAKLKAASRELIRMIHKKVGATTIISSHDQYDAYALADRLVILDEGKIQQVGTVEEIYNHPNNIVVARFLGNPTMNLLDSKYDGNNLYLLDTDIIIPLTIKQKEYLSGYVNKEIYFGIRPENIILSKDNDGILVKLERSEIFGRDFLHHLILGEEEILFKTTTKIKGEEEIRISFDESKVLFFDKQSGDII